MPVIRVNKTKDYTVMSNYHFKEKNMSLKAKGLLSLMLSLPDNWGYSVEGLVNICKENETSINTALKELKLFGYLSVTKLMPNQTENGRIEYIYNVYEKPNIKQDTEKQGVENLGVEFQALENQGLLNINNKDKEIYNNKLLYTKKKKKEFVPPTLEEIKEYCLKRKNNVNYIKFYNYYSSNKWKDSQDKQVGNWKLKVISWEGNETNSYGNNNIAKVEPKLPEWFGKDIAPTEATEEEKAEMEKVMAELESLL